MNSYLAKSFRGERGSGWSWKKWFGLLLLGFIGGVVADQVWTARGPVELIISTVAPAVSDLPGISENRMPEIWSESGNISVRFPEKNSVIQSPLSVEGMERTFEQNVVLRLRDSKGGELVKTAVTGTAPDVGLHGLYRAELLFDRPKTKTGILEVFQASAKDGSEIDKVTMPVRFE